MQQDECRASVKPVPVWSETHLTSWLCVLCSSTPQAQHKATRKRGKEGKQRADKRLDKRLGSSTGTARSLQASLLLSPPVLLPPPLPPPLPLPPRMGGDVPSAERHAATQAAGAERQESGARIP